MICRLTFFCRMKEWSAKKANEKEDRKERKRQRLQNVLDRPSRIKAEDNTYITEVSLQTLSVMGCSHVVLNQNFGNLYPYPGPSISSVIKIKKAHKI